MTIRFAVYVRTQRYDTTEQDHFFAWDLFWRVDPDALYFQTREDAITALTEYVQHNPGCRGWVFEIREEIVF